MIIPPPPTAAAAAAIFSQLSSCGALFLDAARCRASIRTSYPCDLNPPSCLVDDVRVRVDPGGRIG